MQAPPPHDSEALHKARLDYVQRCFQNVHELNRMMDQKANFLLAAVALITGALAVIATAPLNRKTPEEWQVYLRIAAFIFLLIYLFWGIPCHCGYNPGIQGHRKNGQPQYPRPRLTLPAHDHGTLP